MQHSTLNSHFSLFKFSTISQPVSLSRFQIDRSSLMTNVLSFTPTTPLLRHLSVFSILRRRHNPTTLKSPPHTLSQSPLRCAPHPPPRPSRSASALPAPADGLMQDAGATAVVLAGAYGLVLCFDNLTQRNLLRQNLSRKLVHILSGIFFMLSWPIFSTSTDARYFASVVPLVNCLRLLLHGFSLVTNEGLVKSVTREGNPKELLRGPLYYVLILILCALVFWRESPVGLISLAMMCGGDGVADIMGRKFGSIKIPYNPKKSWAGSISMFLFGFLISMGMLYYYSFLGYFELNWIQTAEKVAFVALVATLVESLPITEVLDDNVSVPLASMAAACLIFSL
ncbi:probable phytol kinase 1, chloroplastic [Malus sylvestris]|uniref:probable phytol kinase 1, chloroplastic n=1 Tax=Malus sylvestris TaxID=3752 RepID=UPI0021ABE1C6|nr:probable phytol kinase 1, chloroplastic [Malus sylvestris]